MKRKLISAMALALCCACSVAKAESPIMERPSDALERAQRGTAGLLGNNINNEVIKDKMGVTVDGNGRIINDFTTQRQIGQSTVITGVMASHGNVIDTDETANAVGAELDLQGKGKVHGAVTLIQHGNVTAVGSKEATAAGVQLKADEIGHLTVRSSVHGDVEATASGRGDVSARAYAAQVEGRMTEGTQLNVENNSRGALKALAESQ
jgi:hypothetical protein